MLLAIDTSAGTSVAVVDRDAGILASRDVADTMKHAEVVGRLIQEIREFGEELLTCKQRRRLLCA